MRVCEVKSRLGPPFACSVSLDNALHCAKGLLFKDDSLYTRKTVAKLEISVGPWRAWSSKRGLCQDSPTPLTVVLSYQEGGVIKSGDMCCAVQ
jgi:hypothetical protein